jgi:choline dehydrogenase-like flavoprotein
VSLKDALNDENLALWATQGAGPLSSNTVECGGFLRTRDGLDAPDVQFHMVSGMFVQEGLLPAPAHGFTLSACVLRPESRGQVAIVSPDPTTKPFIVHNYFAEPEDVAAAAEALRVALEIAHQPALAPYTTTPYRVPASDSDADLHAYIRAYAHSTYHPAGTCALGAVVDPQLRVQGVEGLRVADASVFPRIPGGNTNAPTIMVGERACDLLLGRVATPTAVAAT